MINALLYLTTKNCILQRPKEACRKQDMPDRQEWVKPKKNVKVTGGRTVPAEKTLEPNRFEILSVNSDLMQDEMHFPSISKSLLISSTPPKKVKPQGKSKADKEIDQMVRQIQSNRIKVKLIQRAKASLDSLDDPIAEEPNKVNLKP